MLTLFTALRNFFRPCPFEIYTDGGFKKAYGTWAFIITHRGQVLRENFGCAKNTTCTRMEYQAAIEALKTLPKGSRAIVYSDSRTLIDNMTKCLPQWRLNEWRKPAGQNIPSIDKIKELNELVLQHHISWRWCKAHSGITFNERCDQLCIQARCK